MRGRLLCEFVILFAVKVAVQTKAWTMSGIDGISELVGSHQISLLANRSL